MANDRLYLRCRQCGEIIMLAKHFLGSWSFRRTEKEMQEFFDEHFICDGEEDYWGHTFDLVSEMGDGFPEIAEFIPKENGHYYAKINDWTIERKTADESSLFKELEHVANTCRERERTFVGCLNCDFRKNGSCLLKLNGTPNEWKIENKQSEGGF